MGPSADIINVGRPLSHVPQRRMGFLGASTTTVGELHNAMQCTPAPAASDEPSQGGRIAQFLSDKAGIQPIERGIGPRCAYGDERHHTLTLCSFQGSTNLIHGFESSRVASGIRTPDRKSVEAHNRSDANKQTASNWNV